MNDRAVEPPVFQIGFNRCGTKFLTEIFRQNGYEALHWRRGVLAEDILLSKHTRQKPLTRWPSASFFADLECCHRYDKPCLEAFKEFEFLHTAFPDAYFVLNLRNVSDWIASRSAHHGGQYIKFHAHHRGVPVSDVPQLWLADWDQHIRAVRRYFKGNPKFIEFNIDTDSPQKLADFLAQDYHLSTFPKPDPDHLARRKISNVKALKDAKVSRLLQTDTPTSDENTLISDVIVHCLGSSAPEQTSQDATYSGLYGLWDGDKTVLKKDGQPWGLVRCNLEQGDAFLTSETDPKIDRLQGVLNTCLRLGRGPRLAIDMQDARKFGSGSAPNPKTQTIAYNRRPQARNVVLWPLPGYHDIGLETFAQAETPDDTAFDQKRDAVAWRGNLTGRAGFHTGQTRGRPSHKILNDLLSPTLDPKAERKLARELNALPRFEFMLRHHLLEDFDLAFTLPDKFKALAQPDKLGAFCKARKPVSWFHQFKYLVCLSGHDTGSNFFVAANSHSVVFKEDDGWELFYTALFRPWQHYIPIAVGGADMQEKLEWARAHPLECKEMSAASRRACRFLANRAFRQTILNGVLDGVS